MKFMPYDYIYKVNNGWYNIFFSMANYLKFSGINIENSIVFLMGSYRLNSNPEFDKQLYWNLFNNLNIWTNKFALYELQKSTLFCFYLIKIKITFPVASSKIASKEIAGKNETKNRLQPILTTKYLQLVRCYCKKRRNGLSHAFPLIKPCLWVPNRRKMAVIVIYECRQWYWSISNLMKIPNGVWLTKSYGLAIYCYRLYSVLSVSFTQNRLCWCCLPCFTLTAVVISLRKKCTLATD